MKLEETLQQKDLEIMGPPASKEVSYNQEEEKKEAIDLSKVSTEGTSNLVDDNQREDSGS